MSRNPYLAASRPTSSFTRSSRTSSRPGLGSTGGLLGRSRSSATLSGLSSHATGSYGGMSTLSTYVPSSSYQRSSSTSRSRPTSDQRTDSSELESRRAASLHRSTSSHSLQQQRGSRDEEDETYNNDQSHLKNYQERKINHPQQPPILTSRTTRSSLQSIDSDNASRGSDNNINNSYSRSTNKSNTSLDSSSSVAATSLGDDDYDDADSSIGDNIPSGSARHLRQSPSGGTGSGGGGGGGGNGTGSGGTGVGQLSKSKSLDIGDRRQQQQESPLLFSTMSVDRLLLRADSMGERDLRKSFKELVMENERLKQQLKGLDDKDKQMQQDWIRRERQMHRKISELEEENKQIEHWKQEIQRLKDENNSLIRVVSKLSKQH